MSVIPCKRNEQLRKKIEDLAETLKTEAHTLGNHGLSKEEFYRSGLFRGAIERIRGQFSATMREKRDFVQHVLNYMRSKDWIGAWESAGESNRHDYAVQLRSGRTAVIELKGCLDGNNTNIFERPPPRPRLHRLEPVYEPGRRPAAQCVVRNPYSAERGNRLARATGGRHCHLGYGLRDGRAAVSETRRQPQSQNGCRSILFAAAVFVPAAGDDSKPAQQSPPAGANA